MARLEPDPPKLMLVEGTTSFSDDWLLCPILGQPIGPALEVTYLFKLKRPAKLYCVVDSVRYPSQTVVVEPPQDPNGWAQAPPSLIQLTLPDYGQYSVTWSLGGDQIGFSWLIARAKVGTLFALSCDMPAADSSSSLWNDMLNQLNGRPAACLHLGDQIYGDAVYRRLMKSGNPEVGHVYAAYSQLYQETWRPQAELLAQTWNYFTADDHEITNDLRLYHELSDQETLVAQGAWQAYLDYQLALSPGREQFYSQYSYKSWLGAPGDIRLFVVERSSEPLDVRRLIECLQADQAESNGLVVALPCAPVIKPSGLGSSLIRSDRYLETTLAIELYDYLLSSVTDDRPVVLLGGDCHYGSHRLISRGQNVITVLTCSPITNQPGPDRVFAALRTKSRILEPADDRPALREEVVSCRARRNYAEIDFDENRVTMHYGGFRPKSVLKYVRALWSMRKP